MHVGKAIKHLRLLKGFSQKGIARKLRISQPAYSKIEKRVNINKEQVIQILKIMECSTDELKNVGQLTFHYE